MSAIDLFRKRAEENKSILCFGIDPDLYRIQGYSSSSGQTVVQSISHYFHSIIDSLLEENAISALKPNYAYFAQYGFDGLFVLKELMQRYKNKVPIIFDGKRGDIGKTCEAYSKEMYDFWDADAVTISPYMGQDSIAPFLRDDRLVYVLCKTSNPSSKEFQEIKIGKEYLFEKVAKKAAEWDCGLVVGATSDSIKRIVKITKGKTPFLIPGVGTQGGDLEMVMKAIKPNPYIHRVNASSSIAYAYQKLGGNSVQAALAEAESMNKLMRKYLI
jgi:orotidine-5'-phosphate decarboxylase